MKEQILELYAQADKLAKDAMDDVPRRNYNDVLREKFAELIVGECVKLLDAKGQELMNHSDTEDEGHGMRNAAGLLQRTFINLH